MNVPPGARVTGAAARLAGPREGTAKVTVGRSEIGTLPVDRPWLDRTLVLLGVDGAALLAAFTLVLGLNGQRNEFNLEAQLHPLRVVVDLALGSGLLAAFRRLGHYEERRPFWQETGEVMVAFALVLLLEAALLFFLKLDMSRATVLGYWTVGLVYLLVGRSLAKSWLQARGLWSVPAVILGTGPNARDLALALIDDPLPAYEVTAFVHLGSGPGATGDGLLVAEGVERPVLQLGSDPFEIVRRFPRAHLVVALELEELAAAEALVDALSRAHPNVELVLPFRGLPLRRSYRTRFLAHDLSVIRLDRQLQSRWQGAAKRAFDLAGAGVLLIGFAPVMVAIALLIAREGGPVFYAHRRIGRYGRPFHCLKFRTMVPDADERLRHVLATDPAAAEEWRTTRKLKNDPRVTPLGRWLRRTSLDELPQLFNVLKGEMSLVGPRPVTEEEVSWYAEHRLTYLQAAPGMTGLWQVSGRNDLDFRRRVSLDTWYVENWSLWRDIVILLMTVRVVLARRGAY